MQNNEFLANNNCISRRFHRIDFVLADFLELTSNMFPKIAQYYVNNDWLSERDILAAQNKDVDDYHHIIFKWRLDILLSCFGTLINRNMQWNMIAHFEKNVIPATILNRKFKGAKVLIPKVSLIPFEYKRIQFPVRVAVTKTINKLQGHSLEVCVIIISNSHAFTRT